MKPHIASKVLLRNLLENWDLIPDGIPNQKYLEQQLERLERVGLMYRARSQDPKLRSRSRAQARDLEQNVTGMVAGIKFAISFWIHRDEDLLETEGVRNTVSSSIGLVKDRKNQNA